MLKPSLIVAVTALCLGGCALFQAQPPGPAAELPAPAAAQQAAAGANAARSKEAAEVIALLAYYQDVLSMSAEEQKREYQAVSHAYARDRSELGRLRLALLMCLPAAPWRDDAKLQVLLDGATHRKASVDSPRSQFVLLLQKLAAEKLREQRRGDELQHKLDSLLSIERNMRGRQSGSR